MKTAIYPGSFDPVTSGHLDIIKRAARIFNKIMVAVIRNPEKKPFFSLKERVYMLKVSINEAGLSNQVEVDSFDGLLVDYVDKKKAKTIIRGLRAVSDFDYEFQMALTNRKMDSQIETIFFMTDYKYSYLSSSLVKQIAKFKGEISGLVPRIVERRLKDGNLRSA